MANLVCFNQDLFYVRVFEVRGRVINDVEMQIQKGSENIVVGKNKFSRDRLKSAWPISRIAFERFKQMIEREYKDVDCADSMEIMESTQYNYFMGNFCKKLEEQLGIANT